MTRLLAALVVLWVTSACASELPNLDKTPGVVRPLTLEQVCETKWGKDARVVTSAMKRQAFANYGYTGNSDPKCVNPKSKTQKCEIDHLVGRELAGADDIKNLWPQPYAGSCNAHDKDRLENKLHRMACAKPAQIELERAQQALIHDWHEAFKQYVDPHGCD